MVIRHRDSHRLPDRGIEEQALGRLTEGKPLNERHCEQLKSELRRVFDRWFVPAFQEAAVRVRALEDGRVSGTLEIARLCRDSSPGARVMLTDLRQEQPRTERALLAAQQRLAELQEIQTRLCRRRLELESWPFPFGSK
jgi:hypothetical protein